MVRHVTSLTAGVLVGQSRLVADVNVGRGIDWASSWSALKTAEMTA